MFGKVKWFVPLALLSTLLAACGGQSSGQDGESSPTIEMLRPGDPTVVRGIFEPLAEKYSTEQGAPVEIVDMGWDEYFQRLPQLIASGNSPDVQQVQQTLLYRLVQEDAYLPITDMIDDELRAQIPEALWDAATVDGEVYFVPASVGSFVLWYNADLFEKAGLDPESPPQTWDELIEQAEIIEQETGKPGLGFPGNPLDLPDLYGAIFASWTGQPLWNAENQTFNFAGPEGEQALTMLESLVEDGVTQPNATQYTRADLQAMFRDGEVAMVIDGPWIMSTLAAAQDLDSPDSPYRTAALPQRDGPGTFTLAGIEGWSISRDAEDPEAAWDFLRYLVEPENQVQHTLGYGLVPVQEAEQSMPEFEAPYWEALIAAQETSFSRIKSPDAASLNEAVQEAVSSVLLGNASPSEAIAAAEQRRSSVVGD